MKLLQSNLLQGNNLIASKQCKCLGVLHKYWYDSLKQLKVLPDKFRGAYEPNDAM